MKKGIALAAGLLAAAGLTVGATASAKHVKTYDSTITVKSFEASEPGYADAAGRVKSDKAKCLKDRYVEMFRKQSGPDQGVGNTSTKGNGHWDIDVPVSPGKYYADVAESEIGSGVCGQDRSETLFVLP